MNKFSKGTSLLIVLIVYVVAFIIGLISYNFMMSASQNMLLSFFIADVAATVVVWLCGLFFKNASMYDPYWSVAPFVLMLFFVLATVQLYTTSVMYLIVFAFWGVRLTLNWIVGWPGMKHQDWRYTMLRANKPKLWIITNFFGINMMPTLIVFAGMMPAYYAMQISNSITLVTIVGFLICIAATVLQIVSDTQMRNFRQNPENKGKNMESGLWKYSRHPNYLGEVSLWWGVWVIQISVLPVWWTVFAPVAMTALFVFISIPMMEKRLRVSKEGYETYIKSTSILLILPNKKNSLVESTHEEA